VSSQPIAEEWTVHSVRFHRHVYLILLLLAAFLLRWSNLTAKLTIEHDEAFSYLTATCNLVRYGKDQVIRATPVLASEWKQYLRLSEPFCFDQISRDLASSDVHPPLYFWVLHIWTLIFEVAPQNGPAFNIFISMLTAAVLYRLAKKTLQNQRMAFLVAFTYTMNLVVVEVSLVARQYELLAFWTVLLVTLILHLTEDRISHEGRYLILFATIIIAGSLTHYQFLIPVSGAFAYATLKLIKKDLWRLGRILLSVLFAYLLAQWIFPIFSIILRRQGGMAKPPNFIDFGDRIYTSFYNLYSYYYVFFIALILALIMWVVRKRYNDAAARAEADNPLRLDWIGFFLFWILGAIFLLFISFRSPRHAMGARYLSMAWPFMAFLPYFVLRLVNFRKTVLLYFYLIPLVIAFFSLVGNVLSRPADPVSRFQEVDLVLFDNTAAGILLPQIIHLPDDQLVVAGSQEQLLADSAPWLPRLSEESLYVSTFEYARAAEGRDLLLAMIEEAGLEVASAQEYPYFKNTVVYTFCSCCSVDCPKVGFVLDSTDRTKPGSPAPTSLSMIWPPGLLFKSSVHSNLVPFVSSLIDPQLRIC